MVSELRVPVADETNLVIENSVSRSLHSKKRPGTGKVPKKIHKAEREKLKRDHLNEFFVELGQALEPTHQNNGKASILGDATRILRDLLAQVECLKRENEALVTESHYVTLEKNDLKVENTVLGVEIEKLQNELHIRVQPEAGWGNGTGPVHSQHANLASSLEEDLHSLPAMDPTLQAPPMVAPAFVFPFRPEVQTCVELNTVQGPSQPTSNVRRPRARYPNPSDLWPSQLLVHKATQEVRPSGSTSTISNGKQALIAE